MRTVLCESYVNGKCGTHGHVTTFLKWALNQTNSGTVSLMNVLNVVHFGRWRWASRHDRFGSAIAVALLYQMRVIECQLIELTLTQIYSVLSIQRFHHLHI